MHARTLARSLVHTHARTYMHARTHNDTTPPPPPSPTTSIPCTSRTYTQNICAATNFFYTTHVEAEANYTYSKNFGAKFTGFGVGLPMTRLYAQIAGGDLGY